MEKECTTMMFQLAKMEKMASAAKIIRCVNSPFKYFYSVIYLRFIRRSKEGVIKRCKTFFGKEMYILLPSSTDIFLTGGKSHSSEIRLARYMVQNMIKGDTFVDVGAHYGYFTLLGSNLCGTEGKVLSFEPSPRSNKILKLNIEGIENIEFYPVALSNTNSKITFFEFSNIFSEHNSVNIDQYQNESWYKNNAPQPITISCKTLDEMLSTKGKVHFIKIDVEGHEGDVIDGMKNYLISHKPTIIMEFLSEKRSNQSHLRASEFLINNFGYRSMGIDTNGALFPIDDINQFFKVNDIDSDNIVFV